MKRPWYMFVLSVLVAGGIVLLWYLAAENRWVSPIFLPPPGRAWAALAEGFEQDDLLSRVLLTLQHIFYGWVIASIGGIVLGAIVGTSKLARVYLTPTLEFLRPLPPAAVFPAAIVLVGLSENMVVGVIGFGAIWPPLLSTIHGFSTLKARVFEVRDLLKMSKTAFAWKVALPHALPEIVAGLRLSLTIAIVLTVTGEMLSSSDGLGFWIMVQARSFHMDSVFAGVILFGLIGYATAQMMSILQSRLLRWRNP